MQWGPLFEGLKSFVDPCGVGYIEIQEDHMVDTEESLETRNAKLLEVLFRVFGDLFEEQIPHIKNGQLRRIYAQAVEGNRQKEKELAHEPMNMYSMNEFFSNACNTLTNFLNSHE